jgi:Carboxypeptidase regulatory-like domain/TonB dependent receptor-like, beta-barrel/TonB-dependent Receptor Plug Domain
VFKGHNVLGAVMQLALIFFLPSLLIAQSSRVTGELTGTISDNTGAVVPQAAVTATDTSTNQERGAISDDAGRFALHGLHDGVYSVRVRRGGFADAVRPTVTVTIGGMAQLDITLAPASSTQVVTVNSDASILEPERTSPATVIDKERIEESPVQSRNFLNFILLAPGVAGSNPASSQNAPALSGGGFSFGGLRPRSNAIFIDGASNNDEFTGSNRTEISLEDVQEFQVVNHGFAAESGGAAGGSIDVVTRAGANTIHGDAFIFVQNGVTDAKPPLQAPQAKPDLNRERVGLSLGGPIRKDRAFYYSSFEQEHARGEDAPDLSNATVVLVNEALSTQGPRRGLQIANGFFPTEREETEFSQRFDLQINTRHSLMLRYAFTNNREINQAFNTNDLVDSSSRGSSFTSDNALMGGLTSVLNAQSVNDFRFQIATRRVRLGTGDSFGPGIEVPGVIELGRPFDGNGTRHENHYEGSDDYSIQRGNHLFKTGVSVSRIHERSAIGDGFGGLYVFSSLEKLAAGAADYFEQAFGNPDTNFPVTRYAGFAQDHWSLSPRLTMDYGLRYDFTHLPTLFNQDINNLSPRLGVAFRPAATWVVRSGFGLFYDRYPLAAINDVLEKNGAEAFGQVVEGERAQSVYQAGLRYTEPFTGIEPSINTAQPNLANSYSEVANLSLEHSFAENLTVSVGYSFIRGIKLTRTVNVNLLPPTVLTLSNAPSLGVIEPTPQQLGRLVFGPDRFVSSFDRINQLQSTASSTYHGLTLTLNRRMAEEFELLTSYTYSKTLDDASDFNEQPQNPYQLTGERALSLNDQRHRFVMSALWDIPIGDAEDRGAAGPSSNPFVRAFSNVEVAPILSIDSGRPANPLTGTDSNLLHVYPFASRPLDLGRNSLRTPTNVDLDLRVLKTIAIWRGKLDLVAESFNLLNHTNVTQLNTSFGNGTSPVFSFSTPTETAVPRQIQFSLDYEF